MVLSCIEVTRNEIDLSYRICRGQVRHLPCGVHRRDGFISNTRLEPRREKIEVDQLVRMTNPLTSG
jgi:hypothetical protein